MQGFHVGCRIYDVVKLMVIVRAGELKNVSFDLEIFDLIFQKAQRSSFDGSTESACFELIVMLVTGRGAA